jgi:HSP20 family protein
MSFFQKLKNNLGIEKDYKEQMPQEPTIESELELTINSTAEPLDSIKKNEDLEFDKNSHVSETSPVLVPSKASNNEGQLKSTTPSASIGNKISNKVNKIMEIFFKKINPVRKGGILTPALSEKKLGPCSSRPLQQTGFSSGIKEQKENKQKKEETKKIEKEKKGEMNLEKSFQGQADGELVIDVFETNTEFCIQSPIAGINPEDLDISVENEMLIIKGERKKPENGKKKNYFYQECYWGPFSRKIIIPHGADVQKIKVFLAKGILNIEIPKLKNEMRGLTLNS